MLINKTTLSNIIDQGLSKGADFCEVYVEETLSSHMELKSSTTHYISGKDLGVGIRLLYGNEELYTYTNSLDEKNLLQALNNLTALKKSIFKKTINSKKTLLDEDPPLVPFVREFPQKFKPNLEKEKKLLGNLDKELRAYSSLISQSHFVLTKTYKRIDIANSKGILISDIRPYFRFHVSAVATEKAQKERGYRSTGNTYNSSELNEDLLKKLSHQSARQAVQNLKAELAPAGKFPVVINKGFGGVIFHEACGHGMETTSVAENLSVFCNKLGKRVAPSCVTAYDDGTLKGKYGFIKYDDEGRPAQKTCLIEKGILKNYMVDKLGSQKTSYKMTGSARRQSYKYPPTSRMRNTYIDKGDSSLEDMIKDIDYGLFAERLGGGSVMPGTGNYNFAVTSARLIKNGRLDKYVRGACLVGDGLDTLSKITKVGKDLELAPGMCGSVSGWVPVTVGQPPVLVSELTVGGHKT